MMCKNFIFIALQDFSSGRSSTIDNMKSQEGELCPLALRDRGYTIGEEIGGGAFSRVYKANYKLAPDKDIAVKIISLDKVPELWKEKSLRKELKIIRRLQHPNIIRVWDIIKTRHSVYIFMEYAEKNSILHFIKTVGPIPEKDARFWTSQVASALYYMHSKGIAHRDLKNENILLDRDNNAKLTDFGFACFTYDKNTNRPVTAPTLCGTASYIAPEVMTPPYDAKKADCWSLGVCVFEMLTSIRPFDENLPHKVLLQRQLERRWYFPAEIAPSLSSESKELVTKLLEPTPSLRISAHHVLTHPWIIKGYGFS